MAAASGDRTCAACAGSGVGQGGKVSDSLCEGGRHTPYTTAAAAEAGTRRTSQKPLPAVRRALTAPPAVKPALPREAPPHTPRRHRAATTTHGSLRASTRTGRPSARGWPNAVPQVSRTRAPRATRPLTAGTVASAGVRAALGPPELTCLDRDGLRRNRDPRATSS